MPKTARIVITPKQGVLDPQGKTIQKALESLGYKGIGDVRMGKYLEIRFAEGTPAPDESVIREMCNRLLANPVVEDYRVDLGDRP